MRENGCFDTLCNTSDGVFIVDANKRILRCNRAAEKILGCTEAEILNRECFRVISGKSGPDRALCGQNCRVHGAALKGVPQASFDMLIQGSENRPLWLNVTTLTPAGGEEPFLAHVFRDITRDKMKTVALERLLKDLRSGEAASKEMPKNRPALVPAVKARPEAPNRSENGLSDREIEVLTLLAEGHSTKDLAQSLNISHYTARNHIQNILVKLNLHSKAQAVSYAFKKGIL